MLVTFSVLMTVHDLLLARGMVEQCLQAGDEVDVKEARAGFSLLIKPELLAEGTDCVFRIRTNKAYTRCGACVIMP